VPLAPAAVDGNQLFPLYGRLDRWRADIAEHPFERVAHELGKEFGFLLLLNRLRAEQLGPIGEFRPSGDCGGGHQKSPQLRPHGFRAE
jgi:hypothetical protein